MRVLLITIVTAVTAGCSAFVPQETIFTLTLDRAHAVECDIKSLEHSQGYTRLECFESAPADDAWSQHHTGRGSDM